MASHRSKLLRITGIEQTFDYFCGPATAAMVLDFHHVPRPPTATWKADWQQALWLDVISHTAPSETPCTPADPTPCDGYMGFANQLCCNCGGGDCRCWSAAPQALKDTLNLHLATQKVAVQIVKDEDTSAATARLVESIDKNAPGAAVIDGGAHWVVVAGYKLGSGASAVKIGGHNISGIYIRDPDDDGGSVRLIAIDPWLTLRLGPVLCTTPADANRSIVIVGRDN